MRLIKIFQPVNKNLIFSKRSLSINIEHHYKIKSSRSLYLKEKNKKKQNDQIENN